MELPSLEDLALQTIATSLVGLLTEDASFKPLKILIQLKKAQVSTIKESLLELFVRDFPNYLSDILLESLSAPHLKILNLSKCTQVTDTCFIKVIKGLQKLEELHLSCCSQLMKAPVFQELVLHHPQLRSLVLDGCEDVTDDLVKEVLRHCKQLRSLSLSGCKTISDAAFVIPDVNYNAVAAVPIPPPCCLEHVDLSCCAQLTSLSLLFLCRLCGPTLSRVELGWTSMDSMCLWFLCGHDLYTAISFTDTSLSPDDPLSFQDLTRPASQTPFFSTTLQPPSELTHAVATGVKTDEPREKGESSGRLSKDQEEKAVCGNVKWETELKWDFRLPAGTWEEFWFSDDAFRPPSTLAAQPSRTLHPPPVIPLEVGLTFQDGGPGSQLSLLVESLQSEVTLPCVRLFTPRLVSVDLSLVQFRAPFDVTTRKLRHFAWSNPRLRRLVLTWKDLDDATLVYIATHCKELESLVLADTLHVTDGGVAEACNLLPGLRELELKGMSFITDRGVLPLVTSATVLGRLCLAEADITDSTLHALANSAAAHTIRELELSWCENTTEEGISAVATRCRELTKLVLHQCPVSGYAVTLLADNCRALTSLSLANVPSLDDEVLCYMARHLLKLEDIDLSWNSALQDSTIECVLHHCSRLRRLVLTGLKLLTSKPFRPIVADYKRWERAKTLLLYKHFEHSILPDEDRCSSDEEYEELWVPHRSSVYAPRLAELNLEYCDHVDDQQLREMVAVCLGTLRVVDYYAQEVEPLLTADIQGKMLLS